MENDLSERYNEGVLIAPDMAGEPMILQRPAWQPTAEQVQAGRKRLLIVLGVVFALLLVISLALGWGN